MFTSNMKDLPVSDEAMLANPHTPRGDANPHPQGRSSSFDTQYLVKNFRGKCFFYQFSRKTPLYRSETG